MNFTSKQREVVARKLGYDGPMQGFDEFLKSSPALMMKYNAVSDKYAKKMAQGGAVVKMQAGGATPTTYTNQNIIDAYNQSVGAGTMTEAQFVQQAQAMGVTADQLQSARSELLGIAAPTPAPTPAPAAPTPAPAAPTPAPTPPTYSPIPSPVPAPAPVTAPSPAPVSSSISTDQIAQAYRNTVGQGTLTEAQFLDLMRSQYGATDMQVLQARNQLLTAQPPAAPRPPPAPAPLSINTQAILEEWQRAEASGDYSRMRQLLSGLDRNALKSTFGWSDADVDYVLSRTAPPAPAPTTTATAQPVAGPAATLTAQQVEATPEQFVTTVGAPTAAAQTTAQQVGAAQQATAAPTTSAQQMEAQTVRASTQEELDKLTPAQGTVSQQAQVQAQTQEPATTAVGQVQAAQLGAAQQVQAPAARTAQAGEMVSGSAVDQQRIEQLVQQTKADAAQGVVTEDMTVQGQLAKLTANFDATNPPAWAAGSLRAATATLAARGLGASSMAGQAVIQAAIESALPIATADAQAYQQMAAQNLSNRQQTAMLAAQQRAAFMGQEFDQTFQTRVLNAAKVADIANMNFTAQQQIALENARLAQTVDLANLSNQQAVVMAEAAQIANLETANLSNRQQAAVVNAQAFLQMDMANLSNEQQTTLFKAQQITTALLSDQAAENAAKQFNATSQNQTDQFFAGLSTQVSQFNASQNNAMSQFNTDQANAISRFNAEQQNLRDQFNSNQRLVIDQSNAQWRREISTANTAATNAANYLNAQNLQAMTLAQYNNETQLYRDQIEMAWKSYDNDAQRLTTLAAAEIASKATETAYATQARSNMWQAIGSMAVAFWD